MRFATVLATLAVATLASAPALADCIPGTGICAGAGVAVPGVQAGGQVVIGIPPFFGPAPAAPQAAPPAPPPMPRYAPEIQYAPAPSYGYQPPPRYVAARPSFGGSALGIDVHAEGAALGGDRNHNAAGLGGAGLALKYRATPHLALELGLDVVGGHDWNADKRVEVSGHLGGLVYLNPRSRVQVYLAGGFVGDHASASPPSEGYTTLDSQGLTYDHVGGYAGLGLEFYLTRRVSFHVDARGIVREKVGGSPGPEFTDASTGKTTNTSGGVLGQAGMTFYF
jgi:hypothetical protein